VWDLDHMHSRLVDSLDNNDRTTVREFLADQMGNSDSLLNRVKPLLEHGMPAPHSSVSVMFVSDLIQTECGQTVVLKVFQR